MTQENIWSNGMRRRRGKEAEAARHFETERVGDGEQRRWEVMLRTSRHLKERSHCWLGRYEIIKWEYVFISTDRCVCVAEDLWECDGRTGWGCAGEVLSSLLIS